MGRIAQKFETLKAKGEKAFVAYVMAGDPDFETALDLICDMPGAGVDILEIGLPFTDPMADGPTIQLAGQRALDAGMTLGKTLETVRRFRETDDHTPVVVMGYYNPIYSMGVEAFLLAAKDAGVDGLIIVDLPPEEDKELCIPAQAHGIDFIRLTTPTTDEKRLEKSAQNTSGFVYYVSITGITGSATAQAEAVEPFVKRIRNATGLPVCVGFGVKDEKTAAEIGKVADGVVVGSAIVAQIADGKPKSEILKFISALSQAAKA